MRFRLIIEPLGKQHILPINYQYEQSAWIYKTIHYGNPEFSEWLHNQGYTNGRKQFKLFTFSPIAPEQYKINRDRIELLGTHASTTISFYAPEAAEPFIVGLFRNQEFSLGDAISRVFFKVSSVEKLSEPEWNETMRFRTTSPIVITKKTDISSNAQYVSPEEDGYDDLLFNNQIAKMEAFGKPDRFSKPVRFKLLTPPRSKLIKIKASTPQETSVRGFLFDFEINAPPEWLQLGYYAGFGEKNSLGFGSCEVI
jgi:CRISPR-associated endoribonuclease Cas6